MYQVDSVSPHSKKYKHVFILWGGMGRINRLLSLIRHGPHWKRRLQQFFYHCVCIRYRGKVFTEPLPSHDRAIHIQTYRFMGGIFQSDRWDGLRCRDISTKFHKDWFRHSQVNRGDTQTATWPHKPTLFVQNKESRLKIKVGCCDRHAVCLCICVSACLCIPPINFWMPELIFINLGTYTTAPEPISTA
jgi:hypothetical protein